MLRTGSQGPGPKPPFRRGASFARVSATVRNGATAPVAQSDFASWYALRMARFGGLLSARDPYRIESNVERVLECATVRWLDLAKNDQRLSLSVVVLDRARRLGCMLDAVFGGVTVALLTNGAS